MARNTSNFKNTSRSRVSPVDIGDMDNTFSHRLSSEANDADFLVVCDPCLKEDNKRREAVSFCLECAENICSFCKNQHNRFKITKNHSLEGIGTKLSPTLTESCSEHPGRPIEYFCEDHRCLCCKSCYNVSHNQCRETKRIADACKGIKGSLELHQGQENLDKLIQRFKELKSLKQRQHTNITRQKTEELQKVVKLKDSAKTLFETCAERETNGINAACGNIIEQLAIDEETYTSVIETLQCTNEELHNVLISTGESQIFVKLKKSHSTIQKYSDFAEESDMNRKDLSINFRIDESFKTMLGNITSFGKLKVQTTLANTSLSTGKKKKAFPIGGHAVMTRSDRRNCNITGAAFLDDGRIVLVDNNNRCIKLFNQKCKFICHKELPSSPQDIAIITQSQLATSLPQESAIQFFLVNQQLQHGRRVYTGSQYVGLSCHSPSKHMFGSCFSKYGNGRIHIMDSNGQVKQVFSRSSNDPADLVRPTSVQVSSNGNRLFVSDIGRNCVVCFDINVATNLIQTLFVYTDHNLELRNGLSLDQDGNLFVCSGNMSIHQVTLNGIKVQEILSTRDGLGRPNCLCFNSKTEQLLVAEFKENNVKLFKLL